MEWHPTLSRCFQPRPPEVGIAFCLTFPVLQTPELGQAHQVNSSSGRKQGARQEAPPSSPSRGGAGPVRRRGLEGGRKHARLSPFSAAAPQHPRVALLPMAGGRGDEAAGFPVAIVPRQRSGWTPPNAGATRGDARPLTRTRTCKMHACRRVHMWTRTHRKHMCACLQARVHKGSTRTQCAHTQ